MREELEFSRITSPAARCLSSAIDFCEYLQRQDGRILISSPQAPALVCLDKETGKYLAEEASGTRGHGNWSSPAYERLMAKVRSFSERATGSFMALIRTAGKRRRNQAAQGNLALRLQPAGI